MKAGDYFFTFGGELLGPGYEIQKHWVTRVRSNGFDYAGGVVGGSHHGPGLPYHTSGAAPESAFDRGKKVFLDYIKQEKADLRAKLAEVMKRERKLRSLKFKDVKVRGDKETYEQFKRGWDCDC